MNLQGSTNVKITDSSNASSRMNLGIHHLYSACKAAARIEATENNHKGQLFGEFWTEVLHDSLIVATSSVAALESYANELYFEGKFISPALKGPAAQEVAYLIDKESILRKFSLALALRADKKLELGSPPSQNIDALIKLRNLLVHYRSEWSHEQTAHDKVAEALKQRFERSPFIPEHEPLLPKAWASHSFASWSIRSVYYFMEHFYTQADLENPLSQRKSYLQELSRSAL